jgi:hypothetical protein
VSTVWQNNILHFVSSRYVFLYHPFNFDFHSARVIFDVSSGFYFWNVNRTVKNVQGCFKDVSTKNSETTCTYWTILFVMLKIYFIYKVAWEKSRRAILSAETTCTARWHVFYIRNRHISFGSFVYKYDQWPHDRKSRCLRGRRHSSIWYSPSGFFPSYFINEVNF